MTCSVHDWSWWDSESVPGFHRDMFACAKCPRMKLVETRVFDDEASVRAHMAVKTPQQKLAEEIEMEVMRGRSS